MASHTPFLSAVKLAAAVRDREVSAIEVVETYLDRIQRLNPTLNAYITICHDEALNDAQGVDKALASGEDPGPLAGVPVAVKDQFLTRSIRTTAGSRVYENYVPDEDATVIAKLKEAGAVLIGKLNMSELALGGTRQPLGGIPRNPWDMERNPGESSSGSGVAVAALMCGASLGEDTGGSGRTPAAYCGVVGLRPTFTRVTRYGMMPMCWYMDTAAPMTKTVEDAALVLGVIAGYDPRDPLTSHRPVPDYVSQLTGDIRGVRIGLVRELYDTKFMDPEVKGVLSDALEVFRDLGAEVVDVSVPLIPLAGAIFVGVGDTEGAGVQGDILRVRSFDLDQATRTRLQSAALVPAQMLNRALKARHLLRLQMMAALGQVDLLVSATSCYQPPKYASDTARFESDEDVRMRMYFRRAYTGSYALSALPAISIPCGFTRGNLPVGMQLGARPFAEETLLRVARAYEMATPWHNRRPPVTEEQLF